MLKTGCILENYDEPSVIRISIMSRHTLNDGTTPDLRITKDSYDEWWKIFAPPEKLIGSYYKRGLPWEDFERGYFEYLNSIKQDVESLALSALGADVRILCIEEAPEKCHRRLLAERCKNIYPELQILLE